MTSMQTKVRDNIAKQSQHRVKLFDTIQSSVNDYTNSNKRAFRSIDKMNSYQLIDDLNALLFCEIGYQYKCMPWNDSLKQLFTTISNYGTTYIETKLETDENGLTEQVHEYKQFKGYRTYYVDTQGNTFQELHDRDRKLAEEELNCLTKIQQTHILRGEYKSNRIYDSTSQSILCPVNFKPELFAFSTMDIANKHLNEKGNKYRVKEGTQFISIKNITGRPNNKHLKNLQQESFIGSLYRYNKKTKRYEPFIGRGNREAQQQHEFNDKPCYYLEDCIAYVDIDNGLQFNKFMKWILNKHPELAPHMVITEKYNHLKKEGNSSLIYYFSEPLTNEEAKSIQKGIFSLYAKECNVLLGDLNCRNKGFRKNPFMLHKKNLQRNTYILRKSDTELLCNAYKKQDILTRLSRILAENLITSEISKYFANNKAKIIRKNLCFTEIQKAAKTSNTVCTEFKNPFEAYVPKGMRHNTLLKELAMYLNSYVAYVGYDSIEGMSIASILNTSLEIKHENNKEILNTTLFNAIWNSIQSRYELDENEKEITYDYVYKIAVKYLGKTIDRANNDDPQIFRFWNKQANILRKSPYSQLLADLNVKNPKEIEIRFNETLIPDNVRNSIVTDNKFMSKFTLQQAKRGGESIKINSWIKAIQDYSEFFEHNKETLYELTRNCLHSKSKDIILKTYELLTVLLDYNQAKLYKYAIDPYLYSMIENNDRIQDCINTLIQNKIRCGTILQHNKNANYDKQRYIKAGRLIATKLILDCASYLYTVSNTHYNYHKTKRLADDALNSSISLERNNEMCINILANDKNQAKENFLILKNCLDKIFELSKNYNKDSYKQFYSYIQSQNYDITIALSLVEFTYTKNLMGIHKHINEILSTELCKGIVVEIISDKLPEFNDVASKYIGKCYVSNCNTEKHINTLISACKKYLQTKGIKDTRKGIKDFLNINIGMIRAITEEANYIVENANKSKLFQTHKELNEIQLYNVIADFLKNFIEGRLLKFFNAAKNVPFVSTIIKSIQKVLHQTTKTFEFNEYRYSMNSVSA